MLWGAPGADASLGIAGSYGSDNGYEPKAGHLSEPQDVRLETPAFAFGAANVEIAQELHLDFLEPGAATTLAAPTA